MQPIQLRSCKASHAHILQQKELTGEGCVEMDIPWQLCRTIGPLLSQRFPLASAKEQLRGDFNRVRQHCTFTACYDDLHRIKHFTKARHVFCK